MDTDAPDDASMSTGVESDKAPSTIIDPPDDASKSEMPGAAIHILACCSFERYRKFLPFSMRRHRVPFLDRLISRASSTFSGPSALIGSVEAVGV